MYLQDLKSEIRNVAKFLNVDVNDETVERLSDHLSFKKMKGLCYKFSTAPFSIY
jgi:hypothetical protein